MQLHVSGRLVRDPAQKTSATGKPYVHALMTASSSDSEPLITVMAFDLTTYQFLMTSPMKAGRG